MVWDGVKLALGRNSRNPAGRAAHLIDVVVDHNGRRASRKSDWGLAAAPGGRYSAHVRTERSPL
jgi:hypothetical protein